MIHLRDLIPLNVKTEKQRFFTDSNYNPQFTYAQPINPDDLVFYGLPQKKYYLHALRLLKKTSPSTVAHSAALSQEFVTQMVTEVCQSNHIPVPTIQFSTSFLSQAALEPSGLHIRLPILLTESALKGKIHHEIESHYLRVLNHLAHHWPSPVESRAFRATEEGLANLHSYLEEPTKIMRKTCLSYVAAYMAQTSSFRELFNYLQELGASQQLAWSIALKNKRGLEDTSQMSSFTKDIVYFEGAVMVWSWLLNSQHNPADLYLGRLALTDLPTFAAKRAELSQPPTLLLPSFLADKQRYLAIIAKIGETNEFAELV
jgi:hypothetical protein